MKKIITTRYEFSARQTQPKDPSHHLHRHRPYCSSKTQPRTFPYSLQPPAFLTSPATLTTTVLSRPDLPRTIIKLGPPASGRDRRQTAEGGFIVLESPEEAFIFRLFFSLFLSSFFFFIRLFYSCLYSCLVTLFLGFLFPSLVFFFFSVSILVCCLFLGLFFSFLSFFTVFTME